MTSVETIFENGVFRPLSPVAIADNRRVNIHLDEIDFLGEPAIPPRHSAGAYPDDHPEFSAPEMDYSPVPPKSAGTLKARFTPAARWNPPALAME